jgi:transcriptional regulator with XRE-family HTH domain
MDEVRRRAELARFLRTRRERLSPADVGLPVAGRRRTPGLRREELAALAGVGTSWYTWLEQGRAITVSALVLESLARALRLDAAERTHLFVLARRELPATTAATTECVDAATQQMLDALGVYPAYVVNARWDVVAWNQAARRVFLDFAGLSGRERNLLWLIFTRRPLRQLYEDWEHVARHILGLFRVSTARSVGDPWYTELVEDLLRISSEFRAWWPHHEVAESPREAKALRHPLVGRLVLQPNPLQVAHAPDSWLLAYTPMPETDTLAKLQRLASPDTAPATGTLS